MNEISRTPLAIALALAAALGPACSDSDPGDGADGAPAGEDGTDAGETAGEGPDAGPGGALTGAEAELLDAINAERSGRDLVRVAAGDTLLCAARAHAEDIGEREACTHTGADGSSPGDRVVACGGGTYDWNGEIVSCGARTAEGAVDGWLGSPGHRRIMLDDDQRRVGVAVANDYWVAIFNTGD